MRGERELLQSYKLLVTNYIALNFSLISFACVESHRSTQLLNSDSQHLNFCGWNTLSVVQSDDEEGSL